MKYDDMIKPVTKLHTDNATDFTGNTLRHDVWLSQ